MGGGRAEGWSPIGDGGLQFHSHPGLEIKILYYSVLCTVQYFLVPTSSSKFCIKGGGYTASI